MKAKKVLAGILATTMVVGMMSVSALAADEKDTETANKSTSKWATEQIVEEPVATSDGIQVEAVESRDEKACKYTYYMDYVIPEDYEGTSIHINIVQDLIDYRTELYGTPASYVPGDNQEFVVTITNLSEITYDYVENSFEISSAYMNNEESSDYGFDGTALYTKQYIRRTTNSALKALLNTTSNSGSNYTDEKIDTALKKAGYEGIAELNVYYLDYINKTYSKSYTKLEQATDAELCNTILNGYTYNDCPRETNPEIAQLGYNFFYNQIFFAIPTENVDGLGYTQDVTGEYSGYTIGSWMRRDTDETTAYDAKLVENLNNLSAENGKTDLCDITLHLSGPYCTNPYQSTSWSYDMELDLIANTSYTVVHEYYTSLNGEDYKLDGTYEEESVEAVVGQVVTEDDDVTKAPVYDGKTYRFSDAQSDDEITCVYNPEENVLTLRYYRTVEVEADTETDPSNEETTPAETEKETQTEKETETTVTEPSTEEPTTKPAKTPTVEADVTDVEAADHTGALVGGALLLFVFAGLGCAMLTAKKSSGKDMDRE